MKTNLIGCIATLSGSLGKNSEWYACTRNGKTYLCHKPRRTMRQSQYLTSPKAVRSRERFIQAQAVTQEIMRTTVLRERYERLFNQQRRYKTLRGFIMSQCYE